MYISVKANDVGFVHHAQSISGQVMNIIEQSTLDQQSVCEKALTCSQVCNLLHGEYRLACLLFVAFNLI